MAAGLSDLNRASTITTPLFRATANGVGTSSMAWKKALTVLAMLRAPCTLDRRSWTPRSRQMERSWAKHKAKAKKEQVGRANKTKQGKAVARAKQLAYLWMDVDPMPRQSRLDVHDRALELGLHNARERPGQQNRLSQRDKVIEARPSLP